MYLVILVVFLFVPTQARAEVEMVQAPVAEEFSVEGVKVMDMEFDWGIRFKSFQSVERILDRGWEVKASDESGMRAQPFVQLRVKRFAFEYTGQVNEEKRRYLYYGSPMGEILVNTPVMLIGKFVLINNPEYSVTVGGGAEYTEINGKVSMGGFVFPTKGNRQWSKVIQIGAVYRLSEYADIGFGYEKTDRSITTTVPSGGVPQIVIRDTSRCYLTISMRVLGKP